MNQLFALVPDALNDMGAIFARRWWIVLIAISACIATMIAIALWAEGDLKSALQSDGLLRTIAQTAGLLATIAQGVLWYFIYADVLRIGDPAFRLTGSMVFRVIVIGLGVTLLGTAVSIPALVLTYGLHYELLWWPWVLVLVVTLTARLGFVYFAADESEGAFAYSWRVSGGPALVPSVVLALIVCGAVAGLQTLGTLATNATPNLALRIVLDLLVTVLVGFAATAFFQPWTFRWMRVAETMQTIVPE